MDQEWNGIVPRSPVTHSNGVLQGLDIGKSGDGPQAQYTVEKALLLQSMINEKPSPELVKELERLLLENIEAEQARALFNSDSWMRPNAEATDVLEDIRGLMDLLRDDFDFGII